MDRIFKSIILMTILLSLKLEAYTQSKEKVLVVGESNKLSDLIDKLSADFDVILQNSARSIELTDAKALILASENQVDASYRVSVHNFLKKGGNVVFIGKESFNYEPDFINGSIISELKSDFKVIYPERNFQMASLDKPEISFQTSKNGKTIHFETKNRGMRDVLLGISIKNKTSKTKNVLNFRAKGSHFMDLLALEIKDVNGKKWVSFLPLTTDWDTYSVSLANFIPENWNDAKQYPVLNPDLADSLYLGVNTATVWKEKAMGFALGDIKIGENRKKTYQPSAILKTLRLPLLEIGIQGPDWIIDPFFDSKKLDNVALMSGTTFLSTVSLSGTFSKAYTIPEFFYEHPVTTTGTDTKEAYDGKKNRVSRIENLLLDRKSGEIVGQFIQFANGPYKLGSMSSFGIDISDLQNKPAVASMVADLLKQITGKPRIINVSVNTTEKDGDNPIYPLYKVNVQNPTDKTVKGKIELFVNNKLMNTLNVAMLPKVNKQYNLELKSFPTGFSLKNFQWQVKFSTTNSVDVLNDTVNVENAMLTSFKHLVNAQKLYPDGRFSNHYFGDAYGVRAMFAYLDYLKKNPSSKSKFASLFTDFSEADIKNSAEKFYDMLAKRQLSNGAYPMGYSEHTGGYNVADGGQMALSMMQSLRFVTDAKRKESYANSVVRFGNWAEEYYITPELSEQLKTTRPEEYKKGQAKAGLYGLGMTRRAKRLTGPSWVLSDIIGAQVLLSRLASTEADRAKFKIIADRNSKFYVDGNYNAVGYYQAEALFWIYLTTNDQNLKNQIKDNLKETFVKPLLKGVENDMYLLGGRATLKALSLLYYQRYIDNSEDINSVLFKYVWNFASKQNTNSVYQSEKRFPKAIHGESLAASKYAALSSLWAIELLSPGSSLIEFKK